MTTAEARTALRTVGNFIGGGERPAQRWASRGLSSCAASAHQPSAKRGALTFNRLRRRVGSGRCVTCS